VGAKFDGRQSLLLKLGENFHSFSAATIIKLLSIKLLPPPFKAKLLNFLHEIYFMEKISMRY
jgi:hypothetical protein